MRVQTGKTQWNPPIIERPAPAVATTGGVAASDAGESDLSLLASWRCVREKWATDWRLFGRVSAAVAASSAAAAAAGENGKLEEMLKMKRLFEAGVQGRSDSS